RPTHGDVKGVDNYVGIFDCQGQQQVIYKHAISTIAPSRPVPLLDAETEKSE
ncbi:MAG: RNA chaperone Hfq, partial [Oscillospiraceae bacterium]|nr:RNA chaperone Hfq [Oscillospiraceae bacterium]